MSGFFCGFLCLPRLRLIVSRGRSVAVALELAVLSYVGAWVNARTARGLASSIFPRVTRVAVSTLAVLKGLVESRH